MVLTKMGLCTIFLLKYMIIITATAKNNEKNKTSIIVDSCRSHDFDYDK